MLNLFLCHRFNVGNIYSMCSSSWSIIFQKSCIWQRPSKDAIGWRYSATARVGSTSFRCEMKNHQFPTLKAVFCLKEVCEQRTRLVKDSRIQRVDFCLVIGPSRQSSIRIDQTTLIHCPIKRSTPCEKRLGR